MNSLAPVAAENRYQCVVIDDDPDICALISRVLSKIGVTSRGLSSANALAGALKESHPSIVFLDVALDRSDAIDGIRVLRQGSFAGAVQLTSGKDPDLVNNIKAIGERHGLKMLNPLQKPFRSEHLRRIFNGGHDNDPAALPAERPQPIARQPETPPEAVPRVDLAEALNAHWLDMAYQPKVDLVRDDIVGAEGLARIN